MTIWWYFAIYKFMKHVTDGSLARPRHIRVAVAIVSIAALTAVVTPCATDPIGRRMVTVTTLSVAYGSPAKAILRTTKETPELPQVLAVMSLWSFKFYQKCKLLRILQILVSLNDIQNLDQISQTAFRFGVCKTRLRCSDQDIRRRMLQSDNPGCFVPLTTLWTVGVFILTWRITRRSFHCNYAMVSKVLEVHSSCKKM